MFQYILDAFFLEYTICHAFKNKRNYLISVSNCQTALPKVWIDTSFFQINSTVDQCEGQYTVAGGDAPK